MTATQTLLGRLGALDPLAIAFHAKRYDSAAAYQALIALAAPPITPGITERGMFKELVGAIAEACEGDGAAYGFVPCLGGPHLEVWKELLRAYGDPARAAEAFRLYGRE